MLAVTGVNGIDAAQIGLVLTYTSKWSHMLPEFILWKYSS